MTTHDPAAPDHADILDEIRKRWSPRSFAQRAVSPQEVRQLFEAARWAPSSYNAQPWHYVYAHAGDGDTRMNLESLLLPGNAWAQKAPLLIVSFARRTFPHNGKENRFALHDVGCANGYIALQCVHMGLVAHQMAGFRAEDACRLLAVPDEYLPASMIAIGALGDPEALSDELREREEAPRERSLIDEFAFHGSWLASDDGTYSS